MKKIIETTIRRFVADHDFQLNMNSETAILSLTEMIDDAIRSVIYKDVKSKATLTFDLSDPDSLQRFRECASASDMSHFIFQLICNEWRKYKHLKESPHYEEIWENIFELAKEYNVIQFSE